MSRTQILRCDQKRAELVHAHAKKLGVGIYEATEALIDAGANAITHEKQAAPTVSNTADIALTQHADLIREVMAKKNLDEPHAIAWLVNYASGRMAALAKDAEKRRRMRGAA